MKKSGMIKEFREFILRGNVLDMAVGIIIGAAFGSIVSSLVNDVIMPPLGVVLAQVDFKEAKVVLRPEQRDPVDAMKVVKPAATLNYGAFLNAAINFILIALSVFLLVKGVNRLRRTTAPPPPPAAPNTRECPFCISNVSIRATRCPQCASELKPA